MVTNVRKFSQFPNAGNLSPGQLPVGLTADGTTPTGFGNRQFNFTGSSGGVLTWQEVFLPTTIVPNNGYAVSAGTVSFQMPPVFPANATFRIAGRSTGNWIINLYMPGGQTMEDGPVVASVSVASSDSGDTIEVLCIVANTTFVVIGGDGNLVYTS
jgi:hypothetical protein